MGLNVGGDGRGDVKLVGVRFNTLSLQLGQSLSTKLEVLLHSVKQDT